MVFKGGVCKREMNLLADMPGQGIIGQCTSVIEYKADVAVVHVMVMFVRVLYKREMHEMASYVRIRHIMSRHVS
jgi:hypothetical protein